MQIDLTEARASELRLYEADIERHRAALNRVKGLEQDLFYAREALEKAHVRLTKTEKDVAASLLAELLPQMNAPIVTSEVPSESNTES